MDLSTPISASMTGNGGSSQSVKLQEQNLQQTLSSKNALPKTFGFHQHQGQQDSLLGMAPSILGGGSSSDQRLLPHLNISNLFCGSSVPPPPEGVASHALQELTGGSLFDPITDDVFDLEPVPLPNRFNRNYNNQSTEANRLSLLEDTLNQVLQMEATPISDSSECQIMPAKRTAASTFLESRDSFSKRPRTQDPNSLFPASISSSDIRPKMNRFRGYQKDQWKDKFEELLEFKKERGHCCVPHTFEENPVLARWVKRQRYQYKLKNEKRTSTMTDERIEILEKVGFIWDSHGAAWMERWNELAEFRKIFGHSNVASNYAHNPQLATWVKCQRRQYKLFYDGKPSNITPDRISRLEQLGFEWELRSSHKRKPSSSSVLPKTPAGWL